MNRIEERRAIQMQVVSGKQFLPVFESRYLSVEIYKPEKEDLQLPHVRDEFYIIISGEGLFELEGKKSEFRKGDFFFCSGRDQSPVCKVYRRLHNMGVFCGARR